MTFTWNPPTRRRTLIAGLGLAGWWGCFASQAAQPQINTLNGGRLHVAINGYDTVAYFSAGKAVPGLEDLSLAWNGATWRFSSATNLALFKANPERYAPQYGGYCAYGVAQGYLVKVDPEQFTVRDGKLYLNYDAAVQARWSQDIDRHVSSADRKFPQLLRK
ncbi:YHS domain-containing (seleno)protein [Rubrivivax sp. RP6-9]|uniref:YHS domain-containing (seleno)protein n=1 Tax=Rubrivivax sp. RP6-9 TaxID=3415750 RepID=UPI003CC53526